MSDVSPDITPYLDLALFDRDPQAIFEMALAAATTQLPGWEPREGHTEVVLLEGMALEASELVFAINRIPALTTQLLLALFGVERDLGAPATATATFVATDTFGHTILAGTAVRLELDTDLYVDFTVDENAQILVGATEVTVGVTAAENGAEAHAATAGTPLRLMDAISFVETVTLATAPSGGRAAESDEAYLNRGAQVFARLVNTLVLPEHFTAAALENAAVFRAKTVDNFDASAGSGVPGDHAGHVTVYVAGVDGAPLTQPEKDALDAAFEEIALANLAVHVADPIVTSVDVNVTVKGLAGFTEQYVQDSVTAVLDAYLDPNVWNWSGTVRRNELIALIDGAEGVDYVETLTAPAADLALSGEASLVSLGTATVTVT